MIPLFRVNRISNNLRKRRTRLNQLRNLSRSLSRQKIRNIIEGDFVYTRIDDFGAKVLGSEILPESNMWVWDLLYTPKARDILQDLFPGEYYSPEQSVIYIPISNNEIYTGIEGKPWDNDDYEPFLGQSITFKKKVIKDGTFYHLIRIRDKDHGFEDSLERLNLHFEHDSLNPDRPYPGKVFTSVYANEQLRNTEGKEEVSFNNITLRVLLERSPDETLSERAPSAYIGYDVRLTGFDFDEHAKGHLVGEFALSSKIDDLLSFLSEVENTRNYYALQKMNREPTIDGTAIHKEDLMFWEHESGREIELNSQLQPDLKNVMDLLVKMQVYQVRKK